MPEPIPSFDELPELMLSLRSFGSRRRSPNDDGTLDDEQERFFGPLLDSRRTAAKAVTRAQVVASFDARRLTALIDATMRAFAAERYTTRAPARLRGRAVRDRRAVTRCPAVASGACREAKRRRGLDGAIRALVIVALAAACGFPGRR